MRKVCKTVLYVLVILLLGIFSQQEIKAGETNEKRYSRAYSVLSANVGNAKDLLGRSERLKLQPGSDEERVKEGIQDLKKPDILILIEASNREQVLRICNSTGESYFVPDGQYDFVCVKNDIIAKKDNGEQDIKHVSMSEDGLYEKYKGNSVGYVDVGLKDENGRKVRLFYAHFPSPGKGWNVPLHQAHMNAFDWICRNLDLDTSIPCLIAGDLNNDFIRAKVELDKLPMPPSYLIHSSLYIEKRVRDLNLWIFNPLAQPLQLQLLDGSTKRDYEATWRVSEETWKITIDWVIGKFCVPPFLVPGGPETDLITGTTGTVRTNFLTSPPDWWKDTGTEISRLRFDHKPLYGKVVFFWEERIQSPGVVATYVSTDEDEGVLELRKDNTCRAGRFGKWIIQVKRIPTIRLDGTTGETFQHTLIIMGEPLRAVEDNGDYDRIIMAEPLRKRAGTGKQFISLNTPFVGYIEGETISDIHSEEKLIRDKGAFLVKSSEGKLWSSYFDQKDKFSWEFREDGSACLSKIGKWNIEGDVLTIQFGIEGKELSVKCKIKDNTLVTEDGVVLVKKEGARKTD